MLGKAKFNVTINMVNYKKGETYEIKNQVTIDWLDYFEIVWEKSINPKAWKNKEKETPVVIEKPVIETAEEIVEETPKTEWENFGTLEK